MFDIITNPLITILTLLYGLLGNNIVLAIAVLTVVIRLATSPLLISQQRNAKAMQELQPKLNALKEKYKNDREKFSQAQMQLMKEEGVNPLGGCLPLVVQLPILLGLYQAIIQGLSATPFQIIDLSGRLLIPSLDKYVPIKNTWLGMDLTLPPTVNPQYALLFPLMVLATTWLQSRLTMPPPPPSKDGETNQAAAMTRSMTTIMPLMFGFFSLSFSVGLSIYFVVGNIVGIVQYTLMGKAEWGRLLGRQPAPVAAPAAVTARSAERITAPAATETANGKATSKPSNSSSGEPKSTTSSSGGRKRKSAKDKKMRKRTS